MAQEPNIIIACKQLTYTAAHYCCKCTTVFRAKYTLWDVCELASGIDEHLQRDLRTRVPDIPVGWEMNGRDKLTCPECRKKKETSNGH